jgi:transposase
MIPLTDKIFVCRAFTDMRKSINGLMVLAVSAGHTIEVGSCFLFLNRCRDKIKILVREHNGFVLLYKRLDKGQFLLFHRDLDQLILSQQEVRWLLDGLDWTCLKRSKNVSKKYYF